MKILRRQAPGNLKWQLLPAVLGLLLAPAAWGTDALYDNTGVSIYYIPGSPPPAIDAFNFQNEATAEFGVGFSTYSPYAELYETWNTLNYTNLGLMVASSPVATNGAFFIGFEGTFGSGFNFDRQTTNLLSHAIAGSFYNSGDIRCDSTQDGNNIFALGLGGGFTFNFYQVLSLGQFNVWATNIVNPGSIEVGTGGLLKMKGQNVDLSGGSLTLEPLLNSLLLLNGGVININSFFNGYPTANFNGFGATGVNTNAPWDPAANLFPTIAQSSYPDYLLLTNLTAYTDDHQDPFLPNTIVHRAVFLQNSSPDGNVSANVYFDPLNRYSPFGSFYPGCANVGWSANTIDPATGLQVNNFLYLTDDYVWGDTTNVFVSFSGLPDNFVFTTAAAPLLFGPAAPALGLNYPNVALTNSYSFFNGQIVSSTVATNASGVNPSGNITNLPSRVQLTASNTLNLAFTTIAGANYLSLNCTNQFQGSPGASIAVPYSDISLGVTNGFLTLSNVLTANLPEYSGTVQAWSTRFVTVDTVAGITNDYRVLLVFSAFEPSAQPWVQNLYLHGTNTLTLSDHYNVYHSLYSDATSLTLNTNLVGVGASSFDGELLWYNPATFNANSGAGVQQLPNLLWLTNNGAIRTYNNANFGNAAAPAYVVTGGAAPVTNYTAFINHSLVADQGTAIWTSYFESDGTISNGTGSLIVQSGKTVLTNGTVVAGGDVVLGATNTPGLGYHELQLSNQWIRADHKLTLICTNLTGDSATNHNIFVVGATSGGGAADSGFNTFLKGAGDLLGATVTNIAPLNKTIYNVWAGGDYGLSTLGYTNNLAIGHLVLDSLTTNNPNPPLAYVFSGAGAANALYVDLLEMRDGATVGNPTNNYNFPWLKINTNMMVYYGRAIRVVNGQVFDVSEALDYNSQLGANAGRLRWVSSYAGYYSSTNLVYTNTAGFVVTNTVNTALAQSQVIDSDGDGVPNGSDPTPFLVPSALHFTASVTNLPPKSVRVQWSTIPRATNYVYYNTSLLATNGWLAFTNFRNWYFGNGVAVTNATHGNSFTSPQVYVNNPSLADNSQQTNVWVFDTITNVPHYYKVTVWPALMLNDTNSP